MILKGFSLEANDFVIGLMTKALNELVGNFFSKFMVNWEVHFLVALVVVRTIEFSAWIYYFNWNNFV